MIHKKHVGGFGCVIFGHTSFTMASSIIFPFPMASTPHQWRPPNVSVTAIALVCTAYQETPLGAKPPFHPAAQISE